MGHRPEPIRAGAKTNLFCHCMVGCLLSTHVGFHPQDQSKTNTNKLPITPSLSRVDANRSSHLVGPVL